MTEAKHTPGPWITDRTLDENKLAVRPENSPFAICVFEAFVKNSEANARLIAAAPDLLEALTLLEDRTANIGPHISGQAGMLAASIGEALEKARAAISKATGAA